MQDEKKAIFYSIFIYSLNHLSIAQVDFFILNAFFDTQYGLKLINKYYVHIYT